MIGRAQRGRCNVVSWSLSGVTLIVGRPNTHRTSGIIVLHACCMEYSGTDGNVRKSAGLRRNALEGENALLVYPVEVCKPQISRENRLEAGSGIEPLYGDLQSPA
jgi:hypothetical protein